MNDDSVPGNDDLTAAELQLLAVGQAAQAAYAEMHDGLAGIRHGHTIERHGRQKWRHGVPVLAAMLLTGRKLCQGDDRAFGEWLKTHGLANIGPENREALLNMARYPDETAAVLATTKKTSLRTLWLKEIKPKVAASALAIYRRSAADAEDLSFMDPAIYRRSAADGDNEPSGTSAQARDGHAHDGSPTSGATSEPIAGVYKVGRYDDDPIYGLPVPNTLGFFGFNTHEQVIANNQPVEDIVAWLKLLIRKLEDIIKEELRRKREHAIYDGQEDIDRYFAWKGVRQAADVILAQYAKDPMLWAMFGARYERADGLRGGKQSPLDENTDGAGI
jgi:hypothetical protein